MANKNKGKDEEMVVTGGNMPIASVDGKDPVTGKELRAGAMLTLEAQQNVRDIKENVNDLLEESEESNEPDDNSQLLQNISSELVKVNSTLAQISQMGNQPDKQSGRNEASNADDDEDNKVATREDVEDVIEKSDKLDKMFAAMYRTTALTESNTDKLDAIVKKMGIKIKDSKKEGKASEESRKNKEKESKKKEKDSLAKAIGMEFGNVIDQGLDKTLATGFKKIERRMLTQAAMMGLKLLPALLGLVAAGVAIEKLTKFINDKIGPTLDKMADAIFNFPKRAGEEFDKIFNQEKVAEEKVSEAMHESFKQRVDDMNTAKQAGQSEKEAIKTARDLQIESLNAKSYELLGQEKKGFKGLNDTKKEEAIATQRQIDKIKATAAKNNGEEFTERDDKTIIKDLEWVGQVGIPGENGTKVRGQAAYKLAAANAQQKVDEKRKTLKEKADINNNTVAGVYVGGEQSTGQPQGVSKLQHENYSVLQLTHPGFQKKMMPFLAELEREGVPMKVNPKDLVRTVAEQNAIKGSGNLKDGTGASNADGSKYQSYHQWGLAADLVWHGDKRKDGDAKLYGAKPEDYAKMQEIAKRHGLNGISGEVGHIEYQGLGKYRDLIKLYGTPDNFLNKTTNDSTQQGQSGTSMPDRNPSHSESIGNPTIDSLVGAASSPPITEQEIPSPTMPTGFHAKIEGGDTNNAVGEENDEPDPSDTNELNYQKTHDGWEAEYATEDGKDVKVSEKQEGRGYNPETGTFLRGNANPPSDEGVPTQYKGAGTTKDMVKNAMDLKDHAWRTIAEANAKMASEQASASPTIINNSPTVINNTEVVYRVAFDDRSIV